MITSTLANEELLLMNHQYEIEHFPSSILMLHHQHLRLRQPRNLKPVKPRLLKEWCHHLARFLEQSTHEIRANLCALQDAYQTQDLKYCLQVLNNKFPCFPGYPDMIKADFTKHMHYINHYFGQAEHNILPNVPIIAFPKSASSFITTTLCRLFDTYYTVISFNHTQGIPAWIRAFKKWGGILHDHYDPSPTNLQLLYDAGIKKCIIHDRHPVDALISRAHHYLKTEFHIEEELLAHTTQYTALVQAFLEREMEGFLRYHGNWRRRWQQAAASGQIEILNTYYDDMKKDNKSFFENLLQWLGAAYNKELLQSALDHLAPQKNKNSYNFRKATSNEWQEILTAKQIEKVKKIVSEEFPDMFF
jgi:hypothetical protein